MCTAKHKSRNDRPDVIISSSAASVEVAIEAWRKLLRRLLVASIKALCEDGMRQRAIVNSCPSLPLRTIGAG